MTIVPISDDFKEKVFAVIDSQLIWGAHLLVGLGNTFKCYVPLL